MSEVNEQRVCIKFCLKLGKNATETYEMIKTAFGDDSLSRSKIFEWFKRFKNGRETTEDDPRSGRPSTSRNDDVVSKICEKVRNDRRLTVRELADEAGISIGSCHEILTENLQMRRVAAKFVPRLLTLEQKENRLTICQDLKNRSIDPNFIKNIVTGDETWVYGYDPETKAQSSQWKTKFSPRPKKARQVRSSVKTMLIVFFDIEGIVHYEFVPHGQTVNQVFYKDVLMRLREKIRKKCPEKWRTETWFLHHDNAPAHSALSIREFLADKKIPVVPHPPYSPDLAPCDFFLFPKLKFALKGQRFQDVEEIKANTAAELKVLTSEQFQRTFEKWQDRWNHCILKSFRNLSNKDLCQELGISQSTLSTIWKSQDQIKSVFQKDVTSNKRLKCSQNQDVYQALLEWFKIQLSKNISISGPILQEKATEFGKRLNKIDFQCSSSWITHFRQTQYRFRKNKWRIVKRSC
ncbi:hypothetical protein QTP88_008888 [Uroleucon formosanum]